MFENLKFRFFRDFSLFFDFSTWMSKDLLQRGAGLSSGAESEIVTWGWISSKMRPTTDRIASNLPACAANMSPVVSSLETLMPDTL